MADWQRRVWRDIEAVEGVIPSAGARVLVVGNGLPVEFPMDIRVVERAWGEALSDDGGFERIVILAHSGVEADFQLVLAQMWPRLRPDGLLVIAAARPSPWGVRNSVWWRGHPLRRWKRWLRAANWLFADELTVGFSGAWAKLIPVIGGSVRVILAQKRVGGTKILAHTPTKGVVAKPVGVPV